jgi:hypothetical protein
VNPYTEPDEEEEKAKEEEKKDADHVMLLCILFQLDPVIYLHLFISDGFNVCLC